MSNLRWKVATILAVFVVFFGLGVYPILATRYNIPAPGWLIDKQIRLGLDLKGGVHLVLRVQTDDALRLLTEGTADQLREALKTAGLAGATVAATGATSFTVTGVPPEQDAVFRSSLTTIETSYDRASTGPGS